MKHFLTSMISLILCMGIFLTGALAMPGQYGTGLEADENVALAEITPATDLSCFDSYSPRTLKPGEVLRKGVDISMYQGDVNWKTLKASGIEFVFVRVAGRGYAQEGKLYTDSYYDRNIEGAQKAGLKVGVYIYSQATTAAEAVEEADYTLNLIQKYTLELPVVLDFEYACNAGGMLTGRLYNARLSRQAATDVCNAFCDRVKEKGRIPMVYANMSMLNDSLYASKLKAGVWLANFTKRTTYTGDYDFWQCSESGNVPGIDRTVDIDFWFDDGSFGPYRAETGTTPNPDPEELPFTDVAPGSWSYESIRYCYENGIINGLTPTEFGPKNYTTRGQVVTMLYRVEGEPAVYGVTPFTDLVKDYYKKPILWAYKNQIVNGTSANTFEPESFITRQDLVTILYRYCGSPAVYGNLNGYTDAGLVRGYAYNAMVWATQNGIMNGTSPTTLSPMDCATREQIATLIARLMQRR